VPFWIIWICQLKAEHDDVVLSSLLNSAHVTDLSKPLSSGNSLSRFDNAVLVAMLSPAEFTLRYACSRLEMCAIEFLNSDTIEENLAIIQLSFCFVWVGDCSCTTYLFRGDTVMLEPIKQEGIYYHSVLQIHLSEALETKLCHSINAWQYGQISSSRDSNLVNNYKVTQTKLEAGSGILS
jgi:hypothetical protein